MGASSESISERSTERATQVRARRPGRPKPPTESVADGDSRPEPALSECGIHSGPVWSDRVTSWTVFLSSLVLLLWTAPGLDYFLTSRDHGYQLSIGTQILKGRIPGVDVMITYGPMAMYTSAAGLWASGSLIGEMLLCVGGYALCVSLIYRLVAAYSSRTTGLVAAGFGMLLLSRFYKWYVWLIPLATLWVLHRYLSSPARQRRRWLICCGFVLGLSWLYRLDMGTMGLAATIVFMVLLETGHPPRLNAQVFRTVGTLMAAFSVLPLTWFGFLAIKVGGAAPWVFLKNTITGAFTVAKGMSQPLPSDAVAILGYVLVPAVLLVGACTSLNRERAGQADSRSRFLLAASLIGMSVFHQAMHRKGPIHLLQILPPSLICVFVIFATFRQRFSEQFPSKARKWAYKITGLVCFLFLAFEGVGLARWGRQDLVSLSSWPAQRYWDLAHPLDAPERFPAVKLVQRIREQTSSTDSILILPIDCQLYTFADRRLSGRLSTCVPGFFDDPQFHSQNLAAVVEDMPELVVLPSDKKKPAPGDAWADLEKQSRVAHHYLEEFVRERYRHVVYDDGETLVLRREGSASHERSRHGRTDWPAASIWQMSRNRSDMRSLTINELRIVNHLESRLAWRADDVTIW
jgi:hypothetical protein